MPKINQEEYEVLKNLDDNKWKWIARNYNGALITYTDKPTKNPNLYWDSFGERMEDRLFQFIQWSDEEPYNIQELIEEYEKDYKGSWEHAIEFSGEVFGESEETEVKKDLEWLKNEVNKLPLRFSGFSILKQREEFSVNKDDVLELIDQLDEPEVLSQELASVPQFVADWIEEARDRKLTLYGAINECPREVDYWLVDGDSSNQETFARAWLDGFTVEEEQKYYIQITKYDFMVMDDDGYMYPENLNPHDYKNTFTEQEIKDYDERYWPFAVKVEELEE